MAQPGSSILLTSASYAGPGCKSGALARIRTLALLGHYSKCSAGLSYERVTGQEGFQPLAVHRHDADSHRLPRVRWVFLDDEDVSDVRGRKASGECAQVCLIARLERDSVGACVVLLDE